MPKGVPAAQTKRRNTNRAIREFQRWNEEKYPIYDENGNQLILREDEIFVPVWDYARKQKDTDGYYSVKQRGERAYIRVRHNYKLRDGEEYVIEPKCDRNYYVSNYGNVLSFKFHGTDLPLLMTHSESTNGYMQVADAWRSHKIVWFSFMADAIERKQKNPDEPLPYTIPLEYELEVHTLKELKALTKLDDVEIHHRNANRQDNALENLEALKDAVHDLLTAMRNAESEDEQWNIFLENKDALSDDKVTVIFANKDDAVAFETEVEDFWKQCTPEAKEGILDLYWSKVTEFVFNATEKEIGKQFFDRDRYLGVRINGVYAFFKFESNEDKTTVIRLKGYPVNKDLDIIFADGNIVWNNYVVE